LTISPKPAATQAGVRADEHERAIPSVDRVGQLRDTSGRHEQHLLTFHLRERHAVAR
jgi:hypothetical protein